MTEIEKMRQQQPYDFYNQTILDSCTHARNTLKKFNNLTMHDADYRATLEDLIPNCPKDTYILPPFHCDHGNGIQVGEDVVINYNCTFLDGGKITIGNHVKIGPNVQLYTPQHPIDAEERRKPLVTNYPITINDDVWIGGNSTVLPGVTIGARTIIGAGSVVTKDIPSDCLAAGNPCKVIKKLK